MHLTDRQNCPSVFYNFYVFDQQWLGNCGRGRREIEEKGKELGFEEQGIVVIWYGANCSFLNHERSTVFDQYLEAVFPIRP